jgi:hypothetical protein
MKIQGNFPTQKYGQKSLFRTGMAKIAARAKIGTLEQVVAKHESRFWGKEGNGVR